MILPGGGGGGLGPGPVIVTPDPGLLEADPGVMTAAASTFGSAAHQLNSVATATSDAAGKLAAGWTGKGVQGFKYASSDTNWYSSSAADGLIGASMALSGASPLYHRGADISPGGDDTRGPDHTRLRGPR
jgi:uncharacterized protein YukE